MCWEDQKDSISACDDSKVMIWEDKYKKEFHVESSLEIVIENGQLKKPEVALLKPTFKYHYH